MKHIRNEIWILADGRPGTYSQAIGLAEEMGSDYKVIHLTYSMLSELPNIFLSQSNLRLSQASKQYLKQFDYFPNIIISAGRRSAPIALSLKKQSGNRIQTIQIMHPNVSFKHFDVVILPKHDKASASSAPNLITTIGALTRTNQTKIDSEKEKFSSTFHPITKPKIALFIGGDSKKTTFTSQSAKTLAILASTIARNMDAVLLVSNSRRTSDAITHSVKSNLTCDFQFFDFKTLEHNNPYLAIVGYSDYFIVTGDSVSMICECASTGKPIYIFDEHNLSTPKHRAFHHNLYDHGYAKALTSSTHRIENFTTQRRLEETKRVALIINQRLNKPLTL